MIETDIFKISKSAFASILFQRHGMSWAAGGLVLLITALFLGVALDYRILILAIILIFLIAPAMLLILYYNYGLKGKSFLNVLPHRVEFKHNRVAVLLKIKNDTGQYEDEDNDGNEWKVEEEKEEKGEWRRYEFDVKQFGRYSVGRDYVVFPFVAPEEGFLYLPVDAFASPEVFSKAVAGIATVKHKEK